MAEVEEQIFVGECSGGFLHKLGSENEGAPTIMKIELLLNVLSNFERERLLMTQLFDGQHV